MAQVLQAIITVLSAVLLVYWCARTRVLMRGDETRIAAALDADLLFGRRVAMAIRAVLYPPALLSL